MQLSKLVLNKYVIYDTHKIFILLKVCELEKTTNKQEIKRRDRQTDYLFGIQINLQKSNCFVFQIDI